MRDAYIIPVNKSCPGTAEFATLWLADNSSLLILQCQRIGRAHIEFVVGVGYEKSCAELIPSRRCLCLSHIGFISVRTRVLRTDGWKTLSFCVGAITLPSQVLKRHSWRWCFLSGSTGKHCFCSWQSARQKACCQPGTKLSGFICWQTCCFNTDTHSEASP